VVRGAFRERQWSFREDEIIRAAQEYLETRGYFGMSMDDISERVGISKATLYQHFDSKEALVAKALARHVHAFITLVETEMVEGETPGKALERVFRKLIYGRYAFGRALLNDSIGAQDLYQRLCTNDELNQEFKRMGELVQGLVARAQASGEIISSVSAEFVTQTIFSLIDSPNHFRLVENGKLSLDQMANGLVKVFFAGIQPRQGRN
jgi:AcrR family transcriptional regulator